MTNQDRKTLAEALFAVAVENQSQKESRLATLEAENAKLRDQLRGEAAVAEECARIAEREHPVRGVSSGPG